MREWTFHVEISDSNMSFGMCMNVAFFFSCRSTQRHHQHRVRKIHMYTHAGTTTPSLFHTHSHAHSVQKTKANFCFKLRHRSKLSTWRVRLQAHRIMVVFGLQLSLCFFYLLYVFVYNVHVTHWINMLNAFLFMWAVKKKMRTQMGGAEQRANVKCVL